MPTVQRPNQNRVMTLVLFYVKQQFTQGHQAAQTADSEEEYDNLSDESSDTVDVLSEHTTSSDREKTRSSIVR